jgi:FAD synthetase
MEMNIDNLKNYFSISFISKIKHSLTIINTAIEKYSLEYLALSFNGGKDCTVLLYLLNIILQKKGKKCSDFITVCFMIPNVFPEVIEFINKIREKFELKLIIIHNSIKEGLKELLSMVSLKGIFMGTRRTDPFCEKLNYFQMTDKDWPQVMRINPILDWDYHDVWEFLITLKIPYCSLYDGGYTSIGSTLNTVPNPHLKKESENGYEPAYLLKDASKERDGR